MDNQEEAPAKNRRCSPTLLSKYNDNADKTNNCAYHGNIPDDSHSWML